MFPQTNNATVAYYSMVLALCCQHHIDYNLVRKYYLVSYTNGTSLIFLTTNEMDSDYIDRKLDIDFSVFYSFLELHTKLENSFHLDMLFTTNFRNLPKFLCYDIVFIEESIRKEFEQTLSKAIDGYSKDTYNSFENEQIEKWQEAITIL
ncbi:hypothetical protein ACFLSU_02125 [Bacteroidota bacterium]